MRVIRLLIAIAFIALGATVGALNRQPVAIDFGAFHLATTLGVAMLVALLAGVVLGGTAIAASVVLPLRRQLARTQRAQPPTTNGP
jgi:ethanolamine transporter EutH